MKPGPNQVQLFAKPATLGNGVVDQNGQTPGFRAFEFDLPGALLEQLVRVLDQMIPAPLTEDALQIVPEEQGVYQLLLDNRLVYIGKTDAESGLANRLKRHAQKIKHRKKLDPALISFKAVRILVFTAIDLETQLINHYGVKGEWNSSGFGSNDPGRERDTSKPGLFDIEYPIDIDLDLGIDFDGCGTAAAVIEKLKKVIPYGLRVQAVAPRRKTPHAEIVQTKVQMPDGPYTTKRAMEELLRRLPQGWQATLLSSLLILYKETKNDYPGARIIARS
jgi:hypothetical protein